MPSAHPEKPHALEHRLKLARQTEKSVAILEALKGFLVIIAGFAFLEIFNHGAQKAAEKLVRRMHLNPASQYPRIFIAEAGKLTRENAHWMVAAAAVYVAARFIESFGLWRGYAWGRYFAIFAGLIYVPFEIHSMFHHFTVIKVLILAFNLAIVWAIWMAHRSEQASRRLASGR